MSIKLSLETLNELDPNFAEAECIDIPYGVYENVQILDQCKKISKLSVAYNNISKFCISHKFLFLKELVVNSNNIEALDINADLQVLNLNNNKITNIRFFNIYSTLMILDISNNQLCAHQKHPLLSLLPNIVQLTASNCNLTDVSFLVDPKQHYLKLETLNLSDNIDISLKGLNQCKKLTDLTVQRSNLQNALDIASISSLNTLNLQQNYISDISNIGNLANLQYLNLSCNNNLQSLQNLLLLTKIIELDIVETNITNLNGIQNMVRLKTLRSWKNELINVNELLNLTELMEGWVWVFLDTSNGYAGVHGSCQTPSASPTGPGDPRRPGARRPSKDRYPRGAPRSPCSETKYRGGKSNKQGM
ncbi:leucine-rich_repeat domain-containing protein [Hexamita inflata]|uniref:Leucine-rich repeat domain-containing protein n=1 Tax=Hexamita inflata TaxID=28002 RepID=A0AA86R187_9EUKA|nr:leucine-rich repeat domain-containing protein [Hexamita inflata]CAI9952409.1 leucine-rich repeat domain-containing protein [Hexamita inflata]CAI9952433.1 leucine-rich repeat domain-containing protein [Hexamita inflata]CAI9963948.1 leucine-rich repeat domain-containing protein [Hexamita inflata]